jgi:transposase
MVFQGTPSGQPLAVSASKKVNEAFGVDSRQYYSWKEQLEQLCGKAGVKLQFLPAYSPDFNPLEKDWANMKRALRDTVPLCDLLQTAVYDYLA